MILNEKFKRFLWNVYTSGTFDQFDIEITRKIVLLNVLFTIGLVMLVPFGLLAHIKGNHLVGFLDHGCALLVIGSFFHMRKTKNYLPAGYLSASSIFILFIVLFITGGPENSGHLWSLALPLFFMFIFGTKKGTIFILVFFLIVTVLLVFPVGILSLQKYSATFVIRYFGTFLLVYCITFFFEVIRDRTNKTIQQKNVELANMVEELKTADRTFRESEERLRTVITNIPMIIFSVDLKGIFILSEGKGLNALGLKPGELVGKSAFEVYRNVPQFIDNINRAITGEIFYSVIELSGLVFETWFHPISDESGKISGTIGVSIDITERKKAEEALSESEKRFRELADLLPQPVFEADIEGKITYLSRSGYRFSGYSEDDLGKSFDALKMFIPADRERLRKNTVRIFKRENLGGVEYTIKRKDGQSFPVIIHSAPIVKDYKIVGSRGIIIDITKLKQAEEEKRELEEKLRSSEKMEAIGRLAGGVAHDLNNVLSAIVGYPDLLLMSLSERSKLRKPVLTMKQSGQKAAAIVQDLLTLAKREAVPKKVVELNAIVNDYLNSPEQAKILASHPNVSLKVKLDPELHKINGSHVHLTKTLMNLISNASEAMPSGGNIIISTRNRHIDKPVKAYDGFINPGDYVLLKVADEGIGIGLDAFKKIFEPFYTKKGGGKSGTGLGMAVVWGTVNDHDGSIILNSSQETGTVFEIFFPITREKITREVSEANFKDYLGDGEKILVIDDIEEQREIAASLLSKLGYTVQTVANGEQAVEYLRKNSVDLLILDMIMFPGMDGFDTYKKILKLKPKLRAIITSGYSETKRVKEAQKIGAGAYVKKPYTIERIGLVVREELDKNKKVKN